MLEIRGENPVETSKVQSGAPSPALRKWYSHDVSRWPEFQRRYRQELDQNPEAWRPILDLARSRQVTLLFSARRRAQQRRRVARLPDGARGSRRQ